MLNIVNISSVKYLANIKLTLWSIHQFVITRQTKQ